MTTWVSKHRDDILFVVSLMAGVGLIVVGLLQGDTATTLLGAGALGIDGYGDVVNEVT